jgi:hypothetical protein
MKSDRERPRSLTRDHRRIMDAMRATVRAERQRQIAGEGYHPDRDDEHDRDELVRAAVMYAMHGVPGPGHGPHMWPWRERSFRPKEDRRRNLVIAAALLLAELERLERKRERDEEIERRLDAMQPIGEAARRVVERMPPPRRE